MDIKKNQDLSIIPYGSYCYSIHNVVKDEKHGYIIKTKICPYYEFLPDGKRKCLLMNIDSDEDFLIEDQVKICNINDLDDDHYLRP